MRSRRSPRAWVSLQPIGSLPSGSALLDLASCMSLAVGGHGRRAYSEGSERCVSPASRPGSHAFTKMRGEIAKLALFAKD